MHYDLYSRWKINQSNLVGYTFQTRKSYTIYKSDEGRDFVEKLLEHMNRGLMYAFTCEACKNPGAEHGVCAKRALRHETSGKGLEGGSENPNT